MATQGFQTLQSPSNSSYSLKKRASSPPDQVPNRLRKSSFTLGSYLPHEQKSSPSIATNSGESPNTTITLVDSNPSTPRGTLGRTNATANNKNEVSSKIKGNVGGSGVTAVWKNLPPSIMTDSIGPLEDLCLIPDDPMITSIYLERLPNEERWIQPILFFLILSFSPTLCLRLANFGSMPRYAQNLLRPGRYPRA